MSFPTKEVWFDSPAKKPGSFIRVMAHTQEVIVEAAKLVENHPEFTFLFVVEDFDLFNESLPNSWRKPGHNCYYGLPENVWVGAAFQTVEEADSRVERLLKIRAKLLFLVAKKDHETMENIEDYLMPWICGHCGHREFGEVPSYCICGDFNKFRPQVGWIIDNDRDPDSMLRFYCDAYQVPLWDGVSLEVPDL